MPSISTKQFGIVEFAEEDIFEFPHGLPGFEAERRFLCMERPALRPVVFLQSIEHTDLCFITLPAHSVDPGYELEVAPEERTILGLASAEAPYLDQSLACLAIVCLPSDGTPTANLLGPVVLSRETRRGVQAVRDDRRYSAKTPLQSSTTEQNVAEPSPVGKDQSNRLAEV
jgi:flagellar assembly factor FliW